MDYQKIEKYSLITVLCFSIILFIINQSYGLGFILGGLASLLAFRWLQRLEGIPMNDLRVLKKSLLRNKLMRYLIYAISLFIAFMLPRNFNYVTCFLGIMSVRVWIYVLGGRVYD